MDKQESCDMKVLDIPAYVNEMRGLAYRVELKDTYNANALRMIADNLERYFHRVSSNP